MRRTRLFRLLTTLFGVWFTFTLVQPNGMSGMTMSETDASMNMSMSASLAKTLLLYTSQLSVSELDMAMGTPADQMAAMTHESAQQGAESGAPTNSGKPVECDQHDCCCSALSPISLMPEAALAWLPEHIVDQETPRSGDCVVHTDGQLLLPFANGPPRTVSA